MGLILDRARLEAPLKEMADAAVPVVEVHRVQAVQVLHALRQLRLAALEHEVEVIAHQAVDVAAPAEADDRSVDEPEEHEAISYADEDQLAIHPA